MEENYKLSVEKIQEQDSFAKRILHIYIIDPAIRLYNKIAEHSPAYKEIKKHDKESLKKYNHLNLEYQQLQASALKDQKLLTGLKEEKLGLENIVSELKMKSSNQGLMSQNILEATVVIDNSGNIECANQNFYDNFKADYSAKNYVQALNGLDKHEYLLNYARAIRIQGKNSDKFIASIPNSEGTEKIVSVNITIPDDEKTVITFADLENITSSMELTHAAIQEKQINAKSVQPEKAVYVHKLNEGITLDSYLSIDQPIIYQKMILEGYQIMILDMLPVKKQVPDIQVLSEITRLFDYMYLNNKQLWISGISNSVIRWKDKGPEVGEVKANIYSQLYNLGFPIALVNEVQRPEDLIANHDKFSGHIEASKTVLEEHLQNEDEEPLLKQFQQDSAQQKQPGKKRILSWFRKHQSA